MNTITAPYGFVPLSDQVVEPEWLRLRDGTPPPVHDVPFEDGLCGTLQLEIVAETPIFIRGTDAKGEQPFQLSDGRYAIPGTSLRGALRNLVEIITFSRFSRVNDHRYAVRDLHNEQLYRQYMSGMVKDPRTGKQEPVPFVNAGWLSYREGIDGKPTYEIEVCDYAKLEYRALMEVAQKRGVRGFRPGEKQSSVDKYDAWGEASLDIEASVDWKSRDVAGGSVMPSRYGIAKPTSGGHQGRIVMTGQPARWRADQTSRRSGSGGPKHHDFVFFPSASSKRLPVPPRVFQDFEFAHSDRGQQDSLGKSDEPNTEWRFWKKSLLREGRVPVFFLLEDANTLRAFGLALMFRLPYRYSIKETIANFSSAHEGVQTGLDFAEGLFGTARDHTGQSGGNGIALKGRVGISHAFTQGTTTPGRVETAVLGAPKASYYPNYIEQLPGTNGAQPPRDSQGKALYQTWMDSTAVPRGWKRYRPLTQPHIPAPPTGADGRPLDTQRTGSRFAPLPAGTKFVASVDIHNLKPQELGALIWAVEFGGNRNSRHTLGLARPLGFGRTRISIVDQNIRDVHDVAVDLAVARSAFQSWIEAKVPGWLSSAQIRELVALSEPVSPDQAAYQRLDPGRRLNEFADAKKAGLALSSVVSHESNSKPGSAKRRTEQGTNVEPGAIVKGTTLAKTTKKGGPMFDVRGQEAILHPSSSSPPSLSEGDEHTFVVMATGRPLSLKWVDPDGPPPPAPKKSSKGKGRGRGFR